MSGIAGTEPAQRRLPQDSERPALPELFRRMVHPPVAGAPGSPERRALSRFSCVVPLANLAGAIDVFVFLLFVLPLPTVHDNAHLRTLNIYAFAIGMPITFLIGGLWSTAVAAPVVDWLDSGRAPTQRQVALVLRHPLRQLKVNAAMWALAVVLFGALNAAHSASLGALVAITIAIGGMTTCAVGYLLAERILRPITARALAATEPREAGLPGVAARVLLAWAFTTAVPLLGLGVLGVSVLAGRHLSATRFAVTAVFLVGAALVAGLIAMTVAARSLSDPLQSVRGALRRVEGGDLDVEVPVDDGSEVGLVQAGFNRMVSGLREHQLLQDLFGRHVGEEVAREALQRGVRLGGELRDAAVFFVDLDGSTRLATERPPAEVVGLLNRFFGVIVEVTRAHSGLVNKFEGDGALCVFGAPNDVEDPATCALSAARELDERLRRELPEVSAAIGASAGPVVAGNVGAEERFEYTVIGDPVNEAARLMDLAKTLSVHVLASGRAVQAATPTEREHWRMDGEETLRGRSEPTELATPEPVPA